MRRKTCWIICLLLIQAFTLQIAFGESRDYATGEISFGARAVALAGNLVAAGDEMSTLYWNPGSLPFLDNGLGFFGGHNNKYAVADWKEEQFALLLPAMKKMRVGLIYTKENIGLQEAAADNTWLNTYFAGALGFRIKANTGLGLSFVHRSSATATPERELNCSALCLDVGLLINKEKYALGFVTHNINLFNRELAINPDFHAGMKFNFINGRVLTDVRYLPAAGEDKLRVGGGVELDFTPNLTLRAGKNFVGPIGSLSGSVGLGVRKGKWQIDYAYSPHEAAATHYLSTSYQF